MAETMLYREYETIYVLKPELDDAKVSELALKMKAVVEQQGGKHLKITNWGKKKLAFEVDKTPKGIYLHHHYIGKPALVAEYERVLKYTDDAILYQTVRLCDAIDPESKAPEADQLAAPIRDTKHRDRDEHGKHHDDDDGGWGRRDDDDDRHHHHHAPRADERVEE